MQHNSCVQICSSYRGDRGMMNSRLLRELSPDAWGAAGRPVLECKHEALACRSTSITLAWRRGSAAC